MTKEVSDVLIALIKQGGMIAVWCVFFINLIALLKTLCICFFAYLIPATIMKFILKGEDKNDGKKNLKN